MNWYIKVLQNYAVFSGRARRKEFWLFVLFHIIFVIALGVVDFVIGTSNFAYGIGLLSLVYMLGVFIPGIAVTVRRLHDKGLTGWLALLGLVPLVGGIIVLVLMALSGNQGDNLYGPDPRLAG